MYTVPAVMAYSYTFLNIISKTVFLEICIQDNANLACYFLPQNLVVWESMYIIFQIFVQTLW